MFKLFFLRWKDKPPEPRREDIKLIFGLGNPGEKYAETYHNAGQIYVNFITKGPFKKYQDFEFSKEDGRIFVKSLTYMNNSGMAIREALRYFNLKPGNVFIAHDDSDIPLGQYKISFNQGSAGHNGVQSVIDHLKTQNFFRLRIGVRDNQKGRAGEFVLKQISKQHLSTLKEMFSQIKRL